MIVRRRYLNGQPVCKGYSYSNNKITFTDGTAIGVTQADGGDILLDGVLYENKTLSGFQTLNATYENVVAFSSPLYLQIGGSGTNTDSDSGTYTIDGNVITFRSDQRFITQCGFFFPFKGDTSKINICGTDYDPPSSE
jgi:hypothetical protein